MPADRATLSDFQPGQTWRCGETHRLRVTEVADGFVHGDTSEDGGKTFRGRIAFKPDECIFARYAELEGGPGRGEAGDGR